MAKVVLAMESGAAIFVSKSIFYSNRSAPLILPSRTILHKDIRLLLASHSKVFSPPPVAAVVVACRRRRNFSTKATNEVSDSSSVDSILIHSMEKKIKEQLQAESVTVKDAYGDGRHVSIEVISSAFEGQSTLNRQRMVYKAIWEELQSTVHAVDHMTTRTPTEA